MLRSCLAAFALLACACVPSPASPPPAPNASPSPVPSPPPSPSQSPTPAPPVAPDVPLPTGERIDLPVPGHAPAVAWIPRLAGHRPLIVATHGAGGTPEAHCKLWRELLGDGAFILCPRGVTMDVYAPPAARGYFYPAHPALGREVRAAIDALVARYPDRIDREGAIYAGFSQGATMGALAFAPDPAPFASAVLIEGGVEEWTLERARAFKDGGGRRVLFACGRRSCADAARRSAAILARAGVAVRVVDATGAGHTYGGRVREGVAAALPFVIGDDPRWARGDGAHEDSGD